MTDIVERLRGNVPTEPWDEVATAALMGAAADEIEGLRKWNAWFAANNTDWKTKNKEAADEIERLRDTVEQLHKTIDEIEDHYAAPPP